MPREFTFLGAFFPSLILIFVFSALVIWIFDRLAGRYGLYAHVWHPAVLRIALFVIVFGGLGLLYM
jgi:hypothetical protein